GGGGWWLVERLADDGDESVALAPDTKITVETGTIEEVVEASGEVRPVKSSAVRSEISGRIARIFVEDGERVGADQKLIELDQASLLTELREAERNFQSLELQVEQARWNYEREKELFEEGHIQEKTFMDTRIAFELTEIELEVRQARLEKARDNLDKTTIRAPHEGIITEMELNEGQVITGATSVNEGTQLMRINNLDRLFIRIDVNELDIGRVTEGMPARITFDALPDEEFSGEVSRKFPYAREEGGQRLFRLHISFDAPDERVLPGISANVSLPVKVAEDVPVVLMSAVFTERGEKVVYRVDETGRVRRRVVETGIDDLQKIQITSGVEPGDVLSLKRPDPAQTDG
ncbi:MAG: efflux RND transporter periplasmic adaptor subunit, partial [Puniceicoccaceae bacterium]